MGVDTVLTRGVKSHVDISVAYLYLLQMRTNWTLRPGPASLRVWRSHPMSRSTTLLIGPQTALVDLCVVRHGMARLTEVLLIWHISERN